MTAPIDRILANIKISQSSCWEWTAARFQAGYGALRHNGRTVYAHRLSYELHKGPIPAGLNVCHECDNRACVNPKHLFLGTDADNVADKVAKGRQQRGETSPMSKLTTEDVLAIRAATSPQWEIAKAFGISQQQVSSIKTRRRWRHV